MKVLVISKTTNLELHGEIIRKRVASRQLAQQHLEYLKKGHDDHYRTLEALLKNLAKHNIDVVEVGRGLYWPSLSKFSAILTVGGDGSILEASHHINNEDIPLIGIRSSELSVGHLCACDEAGLEQKIKALAQNKLSCRLVHRIKARVEYLVTGSTLVTDPVLNDFLYSNLSPAMTTRYNLCIDDKKQEQRSSGIWVSTPAGSTAVIEAAGGQKVPIESEDYQYRVRELFRPAKGEERLEGGFFKPPEKNISIENLSNKAILALDGQHGAVSLNWGDKISFEKASPLRLANKSNS